MKTFVKRLVGSIGYEVRKVSPVWLEADSNSPKDEIISSPWEYHVLQMANRHYRPKVLRYHRSKYGDDLRLKYIAYFLDVRDLSVLELGPFEGHHRVILEKMGVRENIAIESRTDNLQKCLRIKEKYGLNRTTFVQGDLEGLYNGTEHLKQLNRTFDLVFCLGVLYHVPEPGKALEWFRSKAKTLFLGTHYPEPDTPADAVYSYKGKSYHVREHREGGIKDPISGMSLISLQPYEADLIKLIHSAGYDQVSVLGKDLQNGAPHITILAE